MPNVIFATTEAVPFAKTGGLADVCGRLPIELGDLGHNTSVIMPAFRSVLRSGFTLEPTGIDLDVPVGSQVVTGTLLRGRFPGTDVPVYFVRQDEYFDRPGLYGEDGEDYRDNCQRFVFYSRAVLEAIRLLDLEVDILHCNDWQTGLVPVYLQAEYRAARGYENIATVMTIHNLAYQGRFWHWDMLLTGLDWKLFNWRQLEFYGDLNLLKAGIVFADAITTVSPRYAEEIRQSHLGCGLDGVLSNRGEVMYGILNGVDYDVWNPEVDPFLAEQYGPENWHENKAKCKASLQSDLGLAIEPDVPLIGFIGRLVEQKGAQLIVEQIAKWSHSHPAQWVILGTGDPKLEQRLSKLSQDCPRRVAVRLEFAESLAHQIEAGADIFLMPSRYEPCGLNQMYSLKYGTVPVVHETGGLADTITDATEAAVNDRSANGFTFAQHYLSSMEDALARACDMYQNRREVWEQLVATGMNQDWSWRRSAERYTDLYRTTISRVKQTVCA